MVLIIIKIILCVLLAIIGILLLLLAVRIGFSIRVCGKSGKFFVHAGFLKIDASRFTAGKRKNKIKKQSLAKYLEEKSKNDGTHDVLQPEKTEKRQEKRQSSAEAEKNSAKPENNEKPSENPAAFGAKIKSGHIKNEVSENKTAGSEQNEQQSSDGEKNGNDLKSFFEMLGDKPIPELLSLVKDTFAELKKPFGKYARLKIRKLNIVISTPDAANTAVVYGAASLAYQTLIDVCGEFKFFKIKAKNCGVYYDFSKTESAFSCDIKFTMAVWQLILCLLPAIKGYYGFRKISQKERNV